MISDKPINESRSDGVNTTSPDHFLTDALKGAYSGESAAMSMNNLPPPIPVAKWPIAPADHNNKKHAPQRVVISESARASQIENNRIEFAPLFTNETGDLNETLFSALDSRPWGKKDDKLSIDDLDWYLSEYKSREKSDRINSIFNEANANFVQHLKDTWKGGLESLSYFSSMMDYDKTSVVQQNQLDALTVESRKNARQVIRDLVDPLGPKDAGINSRTENLFDFLDGQGGKIRHQGKVTLKDIDWYIAEYEKHEQSDDLTGFFNPDVKSYLTNLRDNWDSSLVQSLRDTEVSSDGTRTRKDYLDPKRLREIADYEP